MHSQNYASYATDHHLLRQNIPITDRRANQTQCKLTQTISVLLFIAVAVQVPCHQASQRPFICLAINTVGRMNEK